MNAFVSAVDCLREATGAHVMVVHHAGKDDSKGARGSTVLLGACDAEYEVRKKGIDGLVLRTTKQKDAEEAKPIVLRAARVEVDVGGITLASNVLVSDANPARDEDHDNELELKAEAKKTKLGSLEQAILTVLEQVGTDRDGISITGIAATLQKDRKNIERSLENLVQHELAIEIRQPFIRTKLYNLNTRNTT